VLPLFRAERSPSSSNASRANRREPIFVNDVIGTRYWA
jgi:hypothetical protein